MCIRFNREKSQTRSENNLLQQCSDETCLHAFYVYEYRTVLVYYDLYRLVEMLARECFRGN